ncbi:MAG: DUF4105 domain-containing protein [Bacteroidota bacterium]|nr:DUF4105 domain-containing protein [Bacteroidota bacterium]
MLCLCCFFNSVTSSAAAQSTDKPGEKSYFSLLTASPGKEVWSQYGHTGIRFHDPENKLDVVFNYGLFDFSSPNFIWRFVTGQTDYIVGTCSFFDFMLEYQMTNRGVTEQILNLTQQEKADLLHALLVNIQPENRVYRYNFFYKNCSTLPRDIIVKAIRGKVDYRWPGKFKSLRDEVHHFTNNSPWTQFGIDFALGAKADNKADLCSQQFAPDVLKESFSHAMIFNDSLGTRPLVLQTLHPASIDPELNESGSFKVGPIWVMWLVFLTTGALTVLEIRKKKQYHVLDAVLFAVTGLAGCIIFFLVCFSEHPTTDVNYLLLWLHPLHLLYAIALSIPAFRPKAASLYKAVNLPFQLFALAGTLFLPQTLHPAMYPLLLSLMLRSMAGYLNYKQLLKHE